jgi:hypothetical protein
MRRTLLVTAVVAAVVLGAATGVSVVGAQRMEATLPATLGDLINAQMIEVVDGAGQVLLHGTFKTTSNTPEETERKAELMSPTGQGAKGKADIEIARKNGTVSKDEVELEIEKLPVMARLTLLLDGQRLTTFITSKQGKAELKLSRKVAATR